VVKLFMRWMFSPEPSLWIIALAISVGLGLALAPTIRNVRLAHPFFAIAAIWSLGCSFEWLVNRGEMPMRYFVAFVIGGSIFALALTAFAWVERNHDELQAGSSGSGKDTSNKGSAQEKNVPCLTPFRPGLFSGGNITENGQTGFKTSEPLPKVTSANDTAHNGSAMVNAKQVGTANLDHDTTENGGQILKADTIKKLTVANSHAAGGTASPAPV
jgi:hypothetical protein